MARDVSEREFVNYAKGLGGYCAYSDTRLVVAATLRALSDCFGTELGLEQLLPAGTRSLLSVYGTTGILADSVGDREFLLERIAEVGGLQDTASAERALRTVLGTIKEKSQDRLCEWEVRMPFQLREDWSNSVTIDRQQEAGQCL
ncbi:MAG: hypothetical protein Kow00129_13760 [Thermoleophilia bacterium]